MAGIGCLLFASAGERKMADFQENFEKLNMTDRERFRQMINYLLGHTYLLSRTMNFEEETRPVNNDYLFVERNLDLFQDYLSYAGFRLMVDNNYGVMALSSEFEGSRVHFDKFTTLMIYCLRLIYEEEREKITLTDTVFVTTSDIVGKMLTVGAIKKKPSDRQLRDSLRLIGRFNLVLKDSGTWEQADTRYAIMPSLLFIISNERIKNLNSLVKDSADRPDNDVEEESSEEMEEETEED